MASLEFPNLWPGYVVAALSFLTNVTPFLKPSHLLQSLTGLAMLLFVLAGLVYACVCIYKIHKVLLKISDQCYPISPARAVGFRFVPFYNLYWMFKWPGEIIRFVKTRSHIATWSDWVPGLLFLIGGFAGLAIRGVAILVDFLVLSYLIRIMKQSLVVSPRPEPYRKQVPDSGVMVAAIVCVSIIPVIGLLAAIAIPNLLRARINANEWAAKSDLKIIASAAESFRWNQKPAAYPTSIENLVQPAKGAAYLDAAWLTANQPKHGYRFIFKSTSRKFSVLAVPAVPNQSAVNTYCIDQLGVVVGSVNGVNIPKADAEGCNGGVLVKT